MSDAQKDTGPLSPSTTPRGCRVASSSAPRRGVPGGVPRRRIRVGAPGVPLATKCVTSLVGFTVADVVAQTLSLSGPLRRRRPDPDADHPSVSTRDAPSPTASSASRSTAPSRPRGTPPSTPTSSPTLHPPPSPSPPRPPSTRSCGRPSLSRRSSRGISSERANPSRPRPRPRPDADEHLLSSPTVSRQTLPRSSPHPSGQLVLLAAVPRVELQIRRPGGSRPVRQRRAGALQRVSVLEGVRARRKRRKGETDAAREERGSSLARRTPEAAPRPRLDRRVIVDQRCHSASARSREICSRRRMFRIMREYQ